MVGDARALPFPDASFDAVFSYSVLQHLAKADVRTVVAEIRRVLRPGGTRLDRDAERPRPAEPRAAGCGAASRRATARTSATGRCRSCAAAFGAIGPVSITADGFLTINPQLADLDLLPARPARRRARLRRPPPRVDARAVPGGGRRQRDRPGPGAVVNRAADVALASLGLVAREPVPRRRGARGQAPGRRAGPLPPAPGRQGRRRVRAAQAADDGRRRGEAGRRATRSTRATRGSRAPAASLRRLSIDELPQLWNVVRGDMSVIGPRPTLAYQVERYTPRQRRRLEVKPGITGWAQIHGRAALPWDDRIELDVWYVDHRSPKRRPRRSSLRTPLALFAAPTRAPRAAGARVSNAVPRRDRGPLHLRRPARRHRLRVPPRRRRTRSRPTSNPLAPALYHAHEHAIVPRVDDPATCPRCRRSSASTASGSSSRSPTSTTSCSPSAAPSSTARSSCCPAPDVVRRTEDKYEAHLFFEENGIASPASWLPGRAAGRAAVPGAREAPARLRLAAHLPRARTARSSTSTSRNTPADSFVQEVCAGEEFSIDVFCDFEGRCLNGDPADDDRVEGRRVDQGHVDQGRGADRVRSARRRGAADLGPGERPVLPRRRRPPRGHRREPALRRRLPAPARRRQAATRSSRSRSRAASGPSRGSATSARAS